MLGKGCTTEMHSKAHFLKVGGLNDVSDKLWKSPPSFNQAAVRPQRTHSSLCHQFPQLYKLGHGVELSAFLIITTCEPFFPFEHRVARFSK